MLTWDRFNETKQVLETNLSNLGLKDFELLICDQGSSDPRVIELIESYKPNYFRKNSKNEGVGKSLNQLFLRSSGDYIAFLANDILMPNVWAARAISALMKVPNAGLCGFDWGHSCTPPLSWKLGLEAHWLTPVLNRVFGCCVFKRKVVQEIGFFHEGYDVYGIEDSDFNERVNLAGFNSFYLSNARSNHIGVGASDAGEYRAMKDRSLAFNVGLFGERLKNFHLTGIVEPPCDWRDPI